MSGWLWMLRKFGLRRTFWWWREGQRRGWMTKEQSDAFLQSHLDAASRRIDEHTLSPFLDWGGRTQPLPDLHPKE